MLLNTCFSEPQITHKRTFISSITLRNALKCIVQYAFERSPYPLILTLENHVGFAQQPVMADIFVEVFFKTCFKTNFYFYRYLAINFTFRMLRLVLSHCRHLIN